MKQRVRLSIMKFLPILAVSLSFINAAYYEMFLEAIHVISHEEELQPGFLTGSAAQAKILLCENLSEEQMKQCQLCQVQHEKKMPNLKQISAWFFFLSKFAEFNEIDLKHIKSKDSSEVEEVEFENVEDEEVEDEEVECEEVEGEEVECEESEENYSDEIDNEEYDYENIFSEEYENNHIEENDEECDENDSADFSRDISVERSMNLIGPLLIERISMLILKRGKMKFDLCEEIKIQISNAFYEGFSIDFESLRRFLNARLSSEELILKIEAVEAQMQIFGENSMISETGDFHPDNIEKDNISHPEEDNFEEDNISHPEEDNFEEENISHPEEDNIEKDKISHPEEDNISHQESSLTSLNSNTKSIDGISLHSQSSSDTDSSNSADSSESSDVSQSFDSPSKIDPLPSAAKKGSADILVSVDAIPTKDAESTLSTSSASTISFFSFAFLLSLAIIN